MAINAPGTPDWVDLASPDPEVSAAFYESLFGWTSTVSPEPEARGYTMFRLGGKAVAGVGPISMAGQPPAWMTYVATDDAEKTTESVENAGGTVLVGPTNAMSYGRMAVFTDPTGAAFGTWQPGTHPGVEVSYVPGSMTWVELATRDTARAKDFYNSVFGWHAEDGPMGSMPYTTFKLGDQDVAGMMAMEGDMWPADLPAHWMTYFAVTDTDADARRCEELGGMVTVEPTDIPVGRFAVLADPHGAAFSIITMAPTGTS